MEEFAVNISKKSSVLLITTLASFLPAFMSSAVNISLPTVGREFSLDAVILGWVLTAYLLAMAIFQVPFGRAADLYGRRRIFVLGMGVFTAASFLAGLSPGPGALIAFRFVQGVGGAMIFSTAVAILTAVFPPGERGRVLGINVTAVYVALSLGPFFGGIITSYLGWRSIFLLTVPPGLAAMALMRRMEGGRMEGDWKGADGGGEAFDLPGLAVYALSLSALMYGLSQAPLRTGPLLFGISGLIAFVALESRRPAPLMDVRLFLENRVFALSNLSALINYSATFSVGFLLSLYLQYVTGLDPQVAGLVLVVQPMVQAALSPYAGGLSDRVEPRLVVSGGMALTTAGLVLLSNLGMDTGLVYVVATLTIVGVGLAFFSSPNTNAVMSSVDPRDYGMASGMVATMRSTGMMASMAVVMVVFTLVVGRVEIGPENYGAFVESLGIIFWIMAILCALGTVASMARGTVRGSR